MLHLFQATSATLCSDINKDSHHVRSEGLVFFFVCFLLGCPMFKTRIREFFDRYLNIFGHNLAVYS